MIPLLWTAYSHANPWSINYSSPILYIQQGAQSAINSAELRQEIAKKLKPTGPPSIDSVRNVYRYLRKYIRGAAAGGKTIGKRTPDEIFRTKTTHGCHDDGLLFSAILREIGVPALMVDANGVNWMKSFHAGQTNQSFEGHVFVEVFIEGRWRLVDSTSGEFVWDSSVENPWIPIPHDQQSEGYWIMAKGTDLWSYGIRSLQALQKLQVKTAKTTDLKSVRTPSYKIERL